jgi:hypothetical protein
MAWTVSVSTVMLCTGVSTPFVLGAPDFPEMLDCREVSCGGALVTEPRLSALMLPFSLPLSFAIRLGFTLRVLSGGCSAASVCEDVSETPLVSSCLLLVSSESALGDARGLTSCTVSRVDVLAEDPRTGVFTPGTK